MLPYCKCIIRIAYQCLWKTCALSVAVFHRVNIYLYKRWSIIHPQLFYPNPFWLNMMDKDIFTTQKKEQREGTSFKYFYCNKETKKGLVSISAFFVFIYIDVCHLFMMCSMHCLRIGIALFSTIVYGTNV